MKINRALLSYGVAKQFEEEVDFSSLTLDPTHIRKIEKCFVKVTAVDYESILHLDVDISSTVIGVCSYSLEDVELKIHCSESLDFSDDEEDEECYHTKDTIIDLDEYILGILLANVPVRIIKKGAKLPQNGKNYRVLSEEDYEKEKSGKTDHRWDKLDSVKISDD